MCLILFQCCWKKTYATLHRPIIQKKLLVNEIEVTKEKFRNANILDRDKHVKLHKIDEDKASAEDMLSWVKSVRSFKRSATKGKC